MKKFFLIGIVVTILIAVPLTVYILTTQKTTTQSGATPSTLLSFTIPTQGATVGTPVAIPITVDPTGGNTSQSTNSISFIKLVITYDGSKLNAANNYFVPDQKLSTLEGPTQSCSGTTCTISATISTGADPNNTISSPTTVATLNFTPLTPTDSNAPTKLSFASGSQALSIATSDRPAENVLLLDRLQPGLLTIAGGTPSDTPTPTSSGGGSSGGGSSGSTGSTGGSASSAPITCNSFTADNTSSQTTPFTVLFTATGGSTAGNVTKLSFNFGDGQVQDITTGGGIGTNNVSLQQSHIYNSNGTFTATAVLTDSQGNTTTPSSCSQTITVGSGSATLTPTATPTVVASAPIAKPTLPPTGPGNTILGIGAIGATVAVIGVLLVLGI